MTGRNLQYGDKGQRTALYEVAHVIMTMPVKGGALKSCGGKARQARGFLNNRPVLTALNAASRRLRRVAFGQR